MPKRKQKFARRHFLLSVAAIFLAFLIFQFLSSHKVQAAAFLTKPELDLLSQNKETPAICDPAGDYFSANSDSLLNSKSALSETQNSGTSEKINKDNQSQSLESKPKAKSTISNFSAIGKPGKILAETKRLNGKPACAKKNDHPARSKNNPAGQIDGECCLDPDEIPNANCYYPPEKYGKLLERYLASRK